MKKFKKICTCFLSFLILFNSNNFVSFANVEEECKKGDEPFLSKYCAQKLAVDKIKNGEHYVKITDVGLNADSTVYAFDYNNIEKVITELPYTLYGGNY